MLYRIRVIQKSWGVGDDGQLVSGTREEMDALARKWSEHNSKLDVLEQDLSYEVVPDQTEPAQQFAVCGIRLTHIGWCTMDGGRDVVGTHAQMRALVDLWRHENAASGMHVDQDTIYDVVAYTGSDPIDEDEKKDLAKRLRDRSWHVMVRQNGVVLDPSTEPEREDLRPYKYGDRVWVSFPHDDVRARGVVLNRGGYYNGGYYEASNDGYTRVLCENKSRPITVADARVSMRDEPEDFPKDAVVATITTVWVVERAIGRGDYERIGVCRTEQEACAFAERQRKAMCCRADELRHRPDQAIVCGNKVMFAKGDEFAE